MQSSRSPSPISVTSTDSYHMPRVLCDTNGVQLDLADLYCEQRQLTICSVPPCSHFVAQCLPPPPSTCPPNRLTRPRSNYPHAILTCHLQSHSHLAQSKPPFSHNPTSAPPYSEALQMAFYRPSLTEKPAPASPTNTMKTDPTAWSNASFTTKTCSTSPQLAIQSTMARSRTSTSQWATGSTRRPSGFGSTTTELCQGTMPHRGLTSSPISSIYMRHPTTALTPPLKPSQAGSDICSPAPVEISRSCSKLWLTRTIGDWPVTSRSTASSTKTSPLSRSKSSSTNATSTPSGCGSRHVSLDSCSHVPLSGWPPCKTSRGKWGRYVQAGREAAACHAVSMFTPHHWKMSRNVQGHPM
jgi:hypothetical protein